MPRAPNPPAEPEQVATVVQSGVLAGDEPQGVYELTVTEGPDKGQSFTLDAARPSRVLVGQSHVCEIRLSDPEVSRRHVALHVTGTGLRLRDLNSTNGTWVDRVRALEVDLQGDEILRMGATQFRVVFRPRTGPGAASPPALDGFGRMAGASPEMRRLYPLCARLAASNVPVIIEGETGTGKEVLAEAIHEQGPRALGPFVVFDCTAVSPALVESELFGHERGAFTGAVAGRKGVFEQAQGGTLLIDEIGDLALGLQPKLLRAIERCEVRPVGGDRSIKVDVRILAATRRDLDHEVQAGRFRDDLFHRLAVGRIELPPLRDRRKDIELLARKFWKDLGGAPADLGSDALLRWQDDDWSGNVRQLRNAVARLLALGEFEPGKARPPRSSPADAPAGTMSQALDQVLAMPYVQARDRLMDEFEQRYVARILAEHCGDVARAAAASGIGRRYFQKLRARSTK